MATKKKGFTVTSKERRKHLRPVGKKEFWKQHRAADLRWLSDAELTWLKQTDYPEQWLERFQQRRRS